MFKIRRPLHLILALGFCFLIPSIADAQATRTWVSGVGDDVNPCSRTAPCKTFAGAISKTADKGEISCLDPGGFGALNITKSITIDCTGTLASTLAAGTHGFIVNAPGGTVRLRGLTINGASTGTDGVRILAADKVFIENIVIDGFTMSGIAVVSKTPVKVSLSNLSIRNNKLWGVHTIGAVGADVFLSNSLIAGNGSGISASGAGTVVRLSGNSLVFNTVSVALPGDGAKIISFGNNATDGVILTGMGISTVTLK